MARAIVTPAVERGFKVPPADGFDSLPGQGVKARVEGRELQSGGPNLLRALGVEPPEVIARAAEEIASRGQGAIYLLEGGKVLAAFAVADKVREESHEAVRRLHDNGIEVVFLTGDARAVAEAVGAELGIDTVLAEVMPDQKAEVIRDLQVLAAGAGVRFAGRRDEDGSARRRGWKGGCWCGT